MTSVTIQVPDELRGTLEEISRQKQQPLEQVARELIEQAVMVRQLRNLRQELRPGAEYPVWSPLDANDAAATLRKHLSDDFKG